MASRIALPTQLSLNVRMARKLFETSRHTTSNMKQKNMIPLFFLLQILTNFNDNV